MQPASKKKTPRQLRLLTLAPCADIPHSRLDLTARIRSSFRLRNSEFVATANLFSQFVCFVQLHC